MTLQANPNRKNRRSRYLLMAVAVVWLALLAFHSQTREAPDNATDTAAAEGAALDALGAGYKDGLINFALLRQTQAAASLPPIFPPELQNLNGKTVRMRGFMSPFDSLTDMRNFMLMAVPTGCFFCQAPAAQEVVFVRQETDEEMPYIFGAIEVEGTLNLWKPDSEDAAHQSFLFVMTKAKCKAFEGQDASSGTPLPTPHHAFPSVTP